MPAIYIYDSCPWKLSLAVEGYRWCDHVGPQLALLYVKCIEFNLHKNLLNWPSHESHLVSIVSYLGKTIVKMGSTPCLLRTLDWGYIRDMWRPRRSVMLFKVSVGTLRTILFTDNPGMSCGRSVDISSLLPRRALQNFPSSWCWLSICWTVWPSLRRMQLSVAWVEPINNCTLLYAPVDNCSCHFMSDTNRSWAGHC